MVQKNILVSILVNNYNNQKFLKKSINSCLTQTYKNIEIVVFDDNSTDNSKKIIKIIKNKKLKKILSSKKKHNPSISLNQFNTIRQSFLKSKGEIIFLLDSDDYFKKNKIEEVLKIYKKDNHINFVQDLPSISLKKKIEIIDKNNIFSFWPYLAPESCISFKKNFFINFKKQNKRIENDFKDVWLGFRLGVFAYFKEKSFYSLKKNLTIYKSYGESKKYAFFGYNWFNRRSNSFNYLKKIKGNVNNLNLNFDYIFTKLILLTLKFFK